MFMLYHVYWRLAYLHLCLATYSVQHSVPTFYSLVEDLDSALVWELRWSRFHLAMYMWELLGLQDIARRLTAWLWDSMIETVTTLSVHFTYSVV